MYSIIPPAMPSFVINKYGRMRSVKNRMSIDEYNWYLPVLFDSTISSDVPRNNTASNIFDSEDVNAFIRKNNEHIPVIKLNSRACSGISSELM